MKIKIQQKLKKTLINTCSYILIYILCVGCSNSLVCESDCYLDLNSNLTQDVNDFYHIEFLPGYVQTFTTIEAQTGISGYYEKVVWMSNRQVSIQNEWTNLVNRNSYTDDKGVAKTVLGVWEEFIGDTITIYSGYVDQCDIHHFDSLKIIID